MSSPASPIPCRRPAAAPPRPPAGPRPAPSRAPRADPRGRVRRDPRPRLPGDADRRHRRRRGRLDRHGPLLLRHEGRGPDRRAEVGVGPPLRAHRGAPADDDRRPRALARLLAVSVPYPGPARDEYVLWIELWLRVLHQPDLLAQCEAISEQWRGYFHDAVRRGRRARRVRARDRRRRGRRADRRVRRRRRLRDRPRLPLDLARAHARAHRGLRRRAARHLPREAHRPRRRHMTWDTPPPPAAARDRRLRARASRSTS